MVREMFAEATGLQWSFVEAAVPLPEPVFRPWRSLQPRVPHARLRASLESTASTQTLMLRWHDP